MVREACAMKGHPPLKRLPRGCPGLGCLQGMIGR